jgi:hypothetical protein
MDFVCHLEYFRLQDVDKYFKALISFQPLSLIFSDTRFDLYPTKHRRNLSELSAHEGRISFFKTQFQQIGY